MPLLARHIVICEELSESRFLSAQHWLYNDPCQRSRDSRCYLLTPMMLLWLFLVNIGSSIYSHMDYQRIDSKTVAVLKDSLGLKETFSSQLACHLWHRSTSSQKSPRRIWMIPSDVSQRLCTRVNTVSAGILAFVRRQYSQDYESTASGSSGWELTADGARLVLPHVNKKRGRLITVQAEDIELLHASSGKPVAVSQLSSATGKAAKALGPGPCILSTPSHRRESAPAHAGIIIMASQDCIPGGNSDATSGGAMILIRRDCNKQGRQSLLANHGD